MTDLFPYVGSAAETFEGKLFGTNIMKWKVVRRYIKNKSTTEEVLFIPFKSDDFGPISSHGSRACLHHTTCQLVPDL